MPLRRARLTSEVGPDASGSNPGIECTQMPEKSGTDVALSLPLLAGPTVGATACPKAGIATAAASNTKGKYRRSIFMFSPPLRATAASRGFISDRLLERGLGDGTARRM
jgi:hypothetical protein